MEAWNSLYGILAENYAAWSIVGTLFFALVIGYNGAPFWLWSIFTLAALIGFGAPAWLLIAAVVIFAVFLIVPIRRALISSQVIKVLKGVMPVISETERTALEAGVVGAEGELFSGKPNFKKLMAEPYPELTAEERAFMDGPVEDFCALINDWDIWQKRDLPPEAYDFIKKNKFWGMIIPKEYGGLGFSAMAHSEVLQKISSRSVPAVVTIMVPNSLGPAELLIHYGTEEQRKHYLPRLASGEEIPCFALTEPNAGSDAGSIQATGELFKGTDGKLYLKLNWNKRWITLAAISTTLGLAFRLLDPQNLLGKGTDIGITCALIPSKTPGVVIGRRHDPLGTPFYNCPTQGHDVIVSIDQIVGGVSGAGKGWKMLMECLAAGRGISLPAQSTGGAKLASRVVSIHATVRKQFGVAIGKFEGVEEPIARIAGYTYMLEAMRRYTLGAIDKGMKPAVVTAIVKYHATEMGRKVVNDAMDIMGGAGISCGPRNLIAHMYIATPIGITVEGANIMTRTLIMFGQGALRAHPYAFKEVDAIGKNDLKAFDAAFWGHVGHVVRNLCRAIGLSCTRAWIAPSMTQGSVAKYYRRLAWVSASYGFMADVAMGSLGGGLKTKEKITGRYADILAWMYIGTSVLRRFKAEGSRKEDLPFVHYSMNHSLYEIQKAFDGIFANLEVPGLKWFFAGPVRAWSNLNSLAGEPSDQHTHKISSLMLSDSEQRVRLTDGIYMPRDKSDQLALLEETFHMIKRSEEADRKIRAAIKAGLMPKTKGPAAAKVALDKNIITREEFQTMERADQMRWEAIQVDDFSQDEYVAHQTGTKEPSLKAVR